MKFQQANTMSVVLSTK